MATRHESRRKHGGLRPISVQEAATSLRENADCVPSRLESDYTGIICYAEAMVEAAQLRREAALAAEAGDRGTAAEKIAAGQQARNRCPPA